MYFLYVDESGDCGPFNIENPEKSGSRYFIVGGIAIHSSKWKIALGTLKSFRKDIARRAILNYDVEFHCAEMVDPRKIKAYQSISVQDRWKLIEEYAEIIGANLNVKLITVVIDKTSAKLTANEYLTASINKLYQAFDEFLASEKENGIVFFDRANEHHINTHVRKLMGTGASGMNVPGIKIGWVLEDPIFRVSTDSMFIQSTDVVVYTLKEKEFPQASRRKLQAHKIFNRKLMNSIYKSTVADDDGIIRI